MSNFPPPELWRPLGPFGGVLLCLGAFLGGILWLIQAITYPDEASWTAAGLWAGSCLSLAGLLGILWLWNQPTND